MNLLEEKQQLDARGVSDEAVLQQFHGVDGFDVYNCSQPFINHGQRYIFGRVERRGEWMRSWVRLFAASGPDDWTLVPDSMIYTLEDPYVTRIDGDLVLGGTHIRMDQGRLATYYSDFFRGADLADLHYFTSGPDDMKDNRLVALADGRIGVFSRPRGAQVAKQYGSEAVIGFTTVDTLADLQAATFENAPALTGLFDAGQWGGVNQAFLLVDGSIGALGHVAYAGENGAQVYLNMAFVLDPVTRTVSDLHLLATRANYPAAPAKKPQLTDCAFTSGLVLREDGRCDLYSGLGDSCEGRTVVVWPWAAGLA
ncbi:DUF1861 family protein [Lacticaseibacillus mingshuiensis]|uniref:DUF1861 family protein n=1 Tax=Lacticaseibacillus mingshuiensis TaxID=2799574 RepID=UPI00194E1C3F|nr:DUF1861 family protein [Lacticaseibacillus mingshuiensis]